MEISEIAAYLTPADFLSYLKEAEKIEDFLAWAGKNEIEPPKMSLNFNLAEMFEGPEFLPGGFKAELESYARKIQERWDATLIISGRKGRGKSTLGLEAAFFIQYQLRKDGYTPKIWLCFSFADLKEAYEKSGMYDIILVDECVSFIQSGKWNSPEAQEFITLHDESGLKRLTVILIMPEYGAMMKSFRAYRVTAHILIKRRGLAYVYIPVETREESKFRRKPDIKDTFPKLPDDLYKEYERQKIHALTTGREDYGGDYRGYIPKEKVNDLLKKIKCPRCKKNAELDQFTRAKLLKVTSRQIRRYEYMATIRRT